MRMRHLAFIACVAGCAQAIGLSELDFDPDTCDAGLQRACYEGPQGTENQGICLGGTQTCGESGTWGPCEAEVVPKAENCLTPEDESCNGESGCTGNLVWQRSFGGPSTDDGIAVAADERGVVITGTTQGGIDFGAEPLQSPGGVDNMFLAAFDELGALRWGFVVCKSGQAVPHDLALTSDGHAVVVGHAIACESEGASLDGLFVASFDAQGVLLTTSNLAAGVGTLQIAIDNDDRIVVAGAIEATDGGDVYVASVTRELSTTWSIISERAGDQQIMSVATNSANSIFVAGVFEATLELPSTAGAASVTAQDGTKEFFLAGLASDGTPQPVPGETQAIRTFAGFAPTDEVSIRVAAQNDGSPLVAGVFAGSVTFDRTLTAMGEVDSFWAWYRGQPPALTSLQHYDESPGEARAVVVDGDHNWFVAGAYYETFRFSNNLGVGEGADGYNPLVGKILADGGARWAQGDGDMQPQRARDVAPHASGGAYFIGQYQGQLIFGGDPLQVADDPNVFLVRLEP